MKTYVALLLGVNLGKRQMKMAELKAVLEEAGFQNVKTVLASGNAVLAAPKDPTDQIEKALTEAFGYEVRAIVWEQSKLKKLVETEPFKNQVLPQRYHLYATFFDPEPGELGSSDSFRLVTQSKGVAFYIQDRDAAGTVDLMSALKKAVGKGKVTTRNWNTIAKLI